TNENSNGLLREFFPKKTDLARVISQELNQALWLMNNRPRKCLNYQTPLEVFLHELLLIE
ncbi:transposase, partial [Ruoffia sp. FAM 26255]